MKSLEELENELREIVPEEYISADTENSFTLDGHFTLVELKAIVFQIELYHSCKDH